MNIRPLRHVLIVCHARTGGTWAGQLLNTSPHVKYLWEPNAPQHHRKEQIPSWDIDDWVSVWSRVYLFKTHIPIRPEFEKFEMRTAVYKLHTVLGDMTRHAVRWNAALFEKVRSALDAKVVHLVRHPTRWAASILRWMHEFHSVESHELYAESNCRFHDRYQAEPWYRFVRHEDLIDDPQQVLDLLGFCDVSTSPAFTEFVAGMHAEDRDFDDHSRDTTMTKSALADGWRNMPGPAIELAERFTDARWGWAGYQPLRSGRRLPCAP